MANHVSRNYFPLRAWAFPDHSRPRPTTAPRAARRASRRRDRRPHRPCVRLRVATTRRRVRSSAPAADRPTARRSRHAGRRPRPGAVHPGAGFHARHREPGSHPPGPRLARQRDCRRARGAWNGADVGHSGGPCSIGATQPGLHIRSARALRGIASTWCTAHESAAWRAIGIPDAFARRAHRSAIRLDPRRASLRSRTIRLRWSWSDACHPSRRRGGCASRGDPVGR